MADQWEWWRRALSGEQVGGDGLPLTDWNPESGFYRIQFGKNSPWLPVAVWRDSAGALHCLVDGKEIDGAPLWLRFCEHPVSENAYRFALENGDWGDVDPAAIQATAVLIEQNEIRGYAGQVALAVKGVAAYATIPDDDTAARAQSLRAKLQELARTADKRREELKRPHLDAGRKVDDDWRDIIQDARKGAGDIARALTAFETAKAEKARTERVNEPLPTQIRGGYGTAAPIRDVRDLDTVTDWPALFLHYVDDGPAREYMTIRAQREITAGGNPPGATVKLVRRVGPK